jgi:hypothetical protein
MKRKSYRLIMSTVLAAFLLGIAIPFLAPFWLRLPLLFAYCPFTAWWMHRVILGRRAARLYWLRLRLVLGSLCRPDALAERTMRRHRRRMIP